MPVVNGYDLEVRGELDDDQYRKKLAQLVKLTQVSGERMERALNIKVDLDDKSVSARLKKLQAQKINAKELKVEAQTAEAEARLNAVAAKDLKTDLKVDIDAARAETTLKRLQAQAKATTAIDLRADLNVKKAEAELAAFEKLAEQTEIDIPVDVHQGKASIEGLSAGLIQASRGVEQVTSRMGTLALAAGGVGAAFAATGLAIGGFGIATAAKLDSLRFGFERLIGGGQGASKEFDNLIQSAKTTPFDVAQVAELGFRLKSAGRGTKQLTDDVKTLADALVISGGGAEQLSGILFAIQQTASTGIINAQDLRQLNNNITALGLGKDELDELIKEAEKQGFKGPDAMVQALFLAFKRIPGAAGAAAEATEKTFSGKFSNFKDAVQLQFTDAFTPNKEKLFNALDIVSEAIGPALADLAPKISDAFVALAPIIASIIGAAAPLVGLFTQVFTILATKITPYLDKFANYMKNANIDVEKFATIFGGLIAGGALLKVVGAIGAIVTPLAGLTSGLGKIVVALGGFAGAEVAAGASTASFGASLTAIVTGPIGIAIAAFGVLIAAVAAVPNGLKRIKDAIGEAFKGTGDSISSIIDSIKGTVSGVLEALRPIGESVIKAFEALASSGFVGNFLEGVASAFRGVKSAVAPFIEVIARLFAVFQAIVRIFAEPAWSLIGEIFSGIGRVIEWVGEVTGEWFESMKESLDTAGRFVEKIPGFKSIGKAMQGVDDETKKATKSTNELNEASKKAAEESQKAYEELAKQIKDTFKVDPATLDTSSFDALSTSLNTNIESMKTKLADTKSLVENGFGSLVVFANEVGGEAGTKLIGEFAGKIGKDDKALEAFRDQLSKIKALEIVAERDAQKLAATILEGEAAESSNRIASKSIQARGELRIGGSLATSGGPPTIQKTEADKAAKSSADIVQNSFDSAFKNVNLGKALDDSLSGFRTRLNNSLAAGLVLNSVVYSALTAFVSEIATGLKTGVATIILVSNPFKEIGTAVKVGLSEAGGEFSKFIAFMSRLRQPAFDISLGIGEAIIRGLSAGLGSSVAVSIGDSIYRVLADAFNSIAIQIEAAIARIRVQLAVANLFGGGKINVPSVTFPRLESGTGYWKGGPATMNERGPEPVVLPRGSKVIPAHKADEFLGGGGPRVVVNQENTVYGVGFDQAVAEWEARSRAAIREVFA